MVKSIFDIFIVFILKTIILNKSELKVAIFSRNYSFTCYIPLTSP